MDDVLLNSPHLPDGNARLGRRRRVTDVAQSQIPAAVEMLENASTTLAAPKRDDVSRYEPPLIQSELVDLHAVARGHQDRGDKLRVVGGGEVVDRSRGRHDLRTGACRVLDRRSRVQIEVLIAPEFPRYRNIPAGP